MAILEVAQGVTLEVVKEEIQAAVQETLEVVQETAMVVVAQVLILEVVKEETMVGALEPEAVLELALALLHVA